MDFFSQADMLGKVFWGCAIAGTVFFALRVVMMFVAGDMDVDMDGAIDHGDTHGHSSDESFEIFSVNTISSFIMIFGWTGLTCYFQFQQSPSMSIVIAFGAGVLSMFIIAWLFKSAAKLTSAGAQFNIQDTVGLPAEVYQKIPASGSGRITVSLPNGMSKELEATTEQNNDIESFSQVTILSVVNNRTVVVKPA